MSTHPEYDDDFDDYWEGQGHCHDCNGGGWKLACPDDMCHGQYDGGFYAPCGNSNCLYPCRTCNQDGTHGV